MIDNIETMQKQIIVKNLFIVSKWTLRLYAILFIEGITEMVIGVHRPEMGITLFSVTEGICIGIVVNIAFILATFKLNTIGKIIIGVILIPSIIINTGLMLLGLSNILLAVLWGLVIGTWAFTHLLKGGSIHEKSN
ncbi:hypothetical protein HN928_03925 [bacterium]|jgi:hypothetical protein|nr:hypothetical protein [bacterium]MBT7088089.1 hypothetical protein [bacterium]